MQHLAEAAPLRRLAALTAVAIDVSETLTDHAIDVFDRLVGSLFRRALIRAHWDDILRLAMSIRAGTLTASLMPRRLAVFPRLRRIFRSTRLSSANTLSEWPS